VLALDQRERITGRSLRMHPASPAIRGGRTSCVQADSLRYRLRGQPASDRQTLVFAAMRRDYIEGTTHLVQKEGPAMFRIMLMALSCTATVAAPSYADSARATLENEKLTISLAADGSLTLTDKTTQVTWDVGRPLLIGSADSDRPVEISGEVACTTDTIRYRAQDGSQFTLRLVGNPASVDYSVERSDSSQAVQLISKALAVTPGADDYYAVPHRIGLMLRPEGAEPYTRHFGGYQTGGYSMAMCGIVQQGSALLLSWPDPYTVITVDYTVAPAPELALSLALRKSAQRIRLQPLGRGGYIEIAKAYRAIARERGYLVTLAEKLQANPKIERMFGAADFKPFAYMPLAPNTRWNKTDEWKTVLNFTFEECADLAEHLHKDLGIDRAMLVLNGWINGGYDNKHPDILPAAEAIGGNAGLVACAERTKRLGWLFGLHDNYADMYQDASSWDESYLMRNPDGSPRKGGVWAGGQCWLICAKRAVELASRPQNIPGVKQLCAPDIYFSDVIFATPLYECHAPDHPMTMLDDQAAKEQLCDYIRQQVGLFGSEEGREWGVPHADYFEGLMSHRTRWQQPDDTSIILPLFELVFGDAIPLYTHQSDRPSANMPEYILGHILYAEMPVYDFGNHRYYREATAESQPVDKSDAKTLYARGGRHCLIDQFIKNTYEVLSPLGRLTALMEMTDHQFLTENRLVERTRFGTDVKIVVNFSGENYTWQDTVIPPRGFAIDSPSLKAFCAMRYAGVDYSEPTLFVLWARDGKSLEQSDDVRIYHGFGEPRVQFRDDILNVKTPETLVPTINRHSEG